MMCWLTFSESTESEGLILYLKVNCIVAMLYKYTHLGIRKSDNFSTEWSEYIFL